MLTGITYKDINNIIYGDNNETLQSMREGYFQSMGIYLSSFLEWCKEQVIKTMDINDSEEFRKEKSELYDEITISCWLFGMDLYSAVNIATNKSINFSKFAEPSEEKIKIYMEDEELKGQCLTKYDIEPCITNFIEVFIMSSLVEKDNGIVNYPFKYIATLKYFFNMIIQDTFVLCYLQFER